MSGLQEWAQALETTALVGTARRAPGAVTQGLGTPGEGDPQHQLLDQASMFDVLSRAGAKVEQAEPVSPAPPQTRPPAPPPAAQLLALLLRQSPLRPGLTHQCLQNWLRRCSERGHAAPVALLPELLAATHKGVLPRGSVQAIWDERGRWLAELYWPTLLGDDRATPDLTDDDWRALPVTEAVERLTRLRESDPDAARARVEQLFGGYTAKERLAALGALKTGLTLADEPFLDRLLDDRAQTVRQLAARLLASVPGSALSHRMGQRLVPLLEHQRGGLLRKPVVRIVAPSGFDDDAAARDGLPTGPLSGQAREEQLRALLSSASPRVLGQVTGLSPKRIVAVLDMPVGGWSGLVRSVTRHRDREWAEALIGHPKVIRGFGLYQLVEPAQRDRWVSESLRAEEAATALAPLQILPQPWPLSIATQAAQRLATDPEKWFAAGFADNLVAGFGPAALPVVERLVADAEATPGLEVLRRILQFAAFNQSIEEAFASAAPTPKEETA